MGNIHIHKTTGMTVIKNTVFFDYSLSMKAKGLLAQLLSLPEDWNHSVAGLSTLFSDGRSAIESAIHELEEHKYLYRERVQDSCGHFSGYDYHIYESPFTENPLTVKPTTEKTEQYNSIDNNKIRKNNPPSAKASPQGDVKKKDELNLSFITPDFLPIMQKWLQYKKERRQSYKQTGIEVCYKKLLNYSDNDLAKATAIIEDAIANNYQGFFRLRDDNENRGHSRQTATRVIPTDRYQLVY